MQWGKRVTLAASLVLVALVMSACKSNVAGTVVSQSSGAAVASATVTCEDLTASTDASGAFTLDGVKNGERTFSVTLAGYPGSTLKAKVARDMGPLSFVLADSKLAGNVVEIALEPKPIAEASVTVGGVPVVLTSEGTFEVSGLPPGDTTITVTAPNHETTSIAVTLKPGDNSSEVLVPLDAKETYRRYNAAQKFGRHGAAYKYLHPDVRKLLSLKKYVADREAEAYTLVSLKMGDTRVVKSLKSKYTGKTYKRVTQVDRQLIMEYPGYGRETDNWTQHWQKIDGKWYLIWNFPR